MVCFFLNNNLTLPLFTEFCLETVALRVVVLGMKFHQSSYSISMLFLVRAAVIGFLLTGLLLNLNGSFLMAPFQLKALALVQG